MSGERCVMKDEDCGVLDESCGAVFWICFFYPDQPFVSESGSGSAKNPDPIRKNPDPDL